MRTPGDVNAEYRPCWKLTEIVGAAHAVERGTETAKDLDYLRGRATSLGGMRPKCTVVDNDGASRDHRQFRA